MPLISLLELQARFGDKPVKFQVICPQNGLRRGKLMVTSDDLQQRPCLIGEYYRLVPELLYNADARSR